MTQAKSNRHEQRRQRTREAILAAASATFLEKGVSNTTVADITEAADVGYGSFYNHFHSLNDLIPAVAEVMILRVVKTARAITPDENVLELGPAVGVRVLIRLLAREPSIRWLLEHPYVFVDEWQKTVTPFVMEMLEHAAPTSPHAFEVMGGVSSWLAMYPWMIIPALNDAIEQGSSEVHEENFASMALHLLGLDTVRRTEVLAASRDIVRAAALPSGRPLRSKILRD